MRNIKITVEKDALTQIDETIKIANNSNSNVKDFVIEEMMRTKNFINLFNNNEIPVSAYKVVKQSILDRLHSLELVAEKLKDSTNAKDESLSVKTALDNLQMMVGEYTVFNHICKMSDEVDKYISDYILVTLTEI